MGMQLALLDLRGLSLRLRQRHGNVEDRAHALLALHLDGPVHQLHDALGDRHAHPELPYLLVEEESSWLKVSKILGKNSLLMPMR
jgi:hypothetical protein